MIGLNIFRVDPTDAKISDLQCIYCKTTIDVALYLLTYDENTRIISPICKQCRNTK